MKKEKCQHLKEKCQHLKIYKCQHLKIYKCQHLKKEKCQLLEKQLTQQKTVLMEDVNWQDYLIDTVGLMDELIVVPTKEAGVLALETWFTRRSVLGLSAAIRPAGEEWCQTVGTLTIERTSTVGFGVTTQIWEAIHFQAMTSNVSVIHAITGGHPSLVDVNWQLMKKQKCQQCQQL